MSEQMQKHQPDTKNQLALIKKDVVDVVTSTIRQYQMKGELQFPSDYSVENSLKSAWLTLQDTVDKNGKPVLQACDKSSIANALLDMSIQGLSPAKNQCYFLAYGNKLVCMRSYFGTMALAKRVDENIEDIFPEVVYDGDSFKYRLTRGTKEITEHEQVLENVDSKKIKAAYCSVYYRDGRVKTEIMTMDEIKQAWKQSQVKPIDEKGNIRAGTTHEKFTAEMCKRTVINRCCKPIINSSNDSYLFRQSVRRSEEIAAEAIVEEDIANSANQEVIDIEAEAPSGSVEVVEEQKQLPLNSPQETTQAKQGLFGSKPPF
jgi:recombination protein RecT